MASSKNGWTLFILLLVGIVIGGLIGELTSGVKYLNWLSFGYSFGFSDPLIIDLKIIKMQFGLMVDINIASIIGIATALIVYRKAF